MQPELFASGTLFSRIFHASPVAMTITTLGEGLYVDVNEAYATLVGCPREALIGRANVKLFAPDALIDVAFSQTIDNMMVEQTCRLPAADGALRDVIISSQIEEWSGRAYLFTFVQDLTDYNRTQDALRLSEARFRLFFESIPLPVFVFDVDSLRILDVNPATVGLYGYTREELLGMTMLDIRPPETRLQFIEVLHSLPENAQFAGVWKHRRKDDTIFDVELTGYGLHLDGRRARLHVLKDVTKQMALQEALRDSEERLKIIADVTTDVIWDLDLAAATIDYSGGMQALFGYDRGNATPLAWWLGHIHPDERDAVEKSLEQATAGTEKNWSAQYRFQRSDGQYVHVLDRGYILRDESGQALRLIGAMVDITRQVEVKEAATRATMHERRRLARDLHDAVTQSLYSLSLMAEAARRRALAGDERATNDYIARLGELAQQSLKEMRLLVYELQPPVLEREGLAGALQARLDAVERRSGMQARLQLDLDEELAPDVQLQFYRVAEEALNNALKHAAASAIRVRIRARDGWATLEIADNGKGFDPIQAASSGGLGMISMRERLEMLGGHVEVDSAPGKGTIIRVSLNIADGNHEQSDPNSYL